jgi:hypothetical protein
MGSWSHATGSGLGRCAVLAHDGARSAVVVVRADGAQLRTAVRLVLEGGATGAWLGDDGQEGVGLVVTDAAGTVWELAEPWSDEAPRWRSQGLGFSLQGVAGHGRRRVVWGRRPSDGATVLAERVGDGDWLPVPGPGFGVVAVATGPEATWAVGDGGLAAWDGEGWAVLEGVGPHTAVWVGDDVVVVRQDGVVAAGGRQGFHDVGRGPTAAAAVARWRGDVWVGAADGLVALSRGVVRDRPVGSLDARGDLLATTPSLLLATADGQRFAGGLRDAATVPGA